MPFVVEQASDCIVRNIIIAMHVL